MTGRRTKGRRTGGRLAAHLKTAAIPPLLAIAATLSGCTSLSGGSKPPAPVTASASYIAALQGGLIGRVNGVTLGNADRQRALEAEYRALEAAPGGQPVTWEGRAVSGSVVAAAPFQVGSQNCRQYSHTVTVNGQQTVARGAACRNPSGTWTPLT